MIYKINDKNVASGASF